MLYIFGEFHDTFSYIAIMIGVYTALCSRNDVVLVHCNVLLAFTWVLHALLDVLL